jgi:phage tail sheath protein FI
MWGATTMQLKDSALSNVNVARLLKFCARRVDDQLMYSVFDPNDPFLRSEITYRLIDILEPIKLNRGLSNYTVVCTGPEEDNSNNTYEEVANGILNVDVYLEPVIPAKRIFVKLIVNRAGTVLGPVTTI